MVHKILHKDNGSKGEFFIEEDCKNIAEMTYAWVGRNQFIIDYTWVDESLRGQNIGQNLLNFAVNYAREKNVKIIPRCPFVKSIFDKDASICDVLDSDSLQLF